MEDQILFPGILFLISGNNSCQCVTFGLGKLGCNTLGNFLRTMLLYVIHAFLQGISECLNGLGIFFQVTLLC